MIKALALGPGKRSMVLSFQSVWLPDYEVKETLFGSYRACAGFQVSLPPDSSPVSGQGLATS